MKKEALAIEEICKLVDDKMFSDRSCKTRNFSVVCIAENTNYNPDSFSQEIEDDVVHISAKKFLENHSKICPLSIDAVYIGAADADSEGNYIISQETIDEIKERLKDIAGQRKVYEIYFPEFKTIESVEEAKSVKFQKLVQSLFNKYGKDCNTLILGGGYTNDCGDEIGDTFIAEDLGDLLSKLKERGFIAPVVTMDPIDVKKVFDMFAYYDNVSEYLSDMETGSDGIDYGYYLCILAKRTRDGLYDIQSLECDFPSYVQDYSIAMDYPYYTAKMYFK